MIDRLCYWLCMRTWLRVTELPGWVLARAGRYAYSDEIDAARAAAKGEA